MNKTKSPPRATKSHRGGVIYNIDLVAAPHVGETNPACPLWFILPELRAKTHTPSAVRLWNRLAKRKCGLLSFEAVVSIPLLLLQAR